MNRPPITAAPWRQHHLGYVQTEGGDDIACVYSGVLSPISEDEAFSNCIAFTALPQLLDTLEHCLIHTAAMQQDGRTIKERKELAASTHAKIKAALLQAGYTE